MTVTVEKTLAGQMSDILKESDYHGLKSAFKQKHYVAWGFAYDFSEG